MRSVRRVLLLGGTGQLGTEIRRRWAGFEISSPSRAEVDITDAGAVTSKISSERPDAVVNCAAFHDLERCERDAGSAFAANAIAVGMLAEICAGYGAILVSISTDYVFDGELRRPYVESDAANPINTYGISKYAGELLALRLKSPAYIVRTCGLYSGVESRTRGQAFAIRALQKARSGESPSAVTDRVVSPTYAGDVAGGLLRLLESRAPYGLYHMANEGAVSWYEFLCEAERLAGISARINPISREDVPSGLRRPVYSALENYRLHEIGIALPTWREGFISYLRGGTRPH
jgi:dTDP-4-dehydrorhamnose reductase